MSHSPTKPTSNRAAQIGWHKKYAPTIKTTLLNAPEAKSILTATLPAREACGSSCISLFLIKFCEVRGSSVFR
jgi:hypothetical protein